MNSVIIQTAADFFRQYKLDKPDSRIDLDPYNDGIQNDDVQIGEFVGHYKGLPEAHRYAALRRLHDLRDFSTIKTLIGSTVSGTQLLDKGFRKFATEIIEEYKERLNQSKASCDKNDVWKGRLEALKLEYILEDLLRIYNVNHLLNSALEYTEGYWNSRSIDDVADDRKWLYGKLDTIHGSAHYVKTANGAAICYLDTDGDLSPLKPKTWEQAFDPNDFHPLDKRFKFDADGDGVAQAVDANDNNPKRWLPKEFKVGTSIRLGVLKITRLGRNKFRFSVTLKVAPDKNCKNRKLVKKKFLNKRFLKGFAGRIKKAFKESLVGGDIQVSFKIRFKVIKNPSKANVRFTDRNVRDNSSRWTLGTLIQDDSRVALHETGHHIDLDDRYNEPLSWRDLTLRYGFARLFKNCFMKSGNRIYPVDLKNLIASIASEKFGASKYDDIDDIDDDIDDIADIDEPDDIDETYDIDKRIGYYGKYYERLKAFFEKKYSDFDNKGAGDKYLISLLDDFQKELQSATSDVERLVLYDFTTSFMLLNLSDWETPPGVFSQYPRSSYFERAVECLVEAVKINLKYHYQYSKGSDSKLSILSDVIFSLEELPHQNARQEVTEMLRQLYEYEKERASKGQNNALSTAVELYMEALNKLGIDKEIERVRKDVKENTNGTDDIYKTNNINSEIGYYGRYHRKIDDRLGWKYFNALNKDLSDKYLISLLDDFEKELQLTKSDLERLVLYDFTTAFMYFNLSQWETHPGVFSQNPGSPYFAKAVKCLVETIKINLKYHYQYSKGSDSQLKKLSRVISALEKLPDKNAWQEAIEMMHKLYEYEKERASKGQNNALSTAAKLYAETLTRFKMQPDPDEEIKRVREGFIGKTEKDFANKLGETPQYSWEWKKYAFMLFKNNFGADALKLLKRYSEVKYFNRRRHNFGNRVGIYNKIIEDLVDDISEEDLVLEVFTAIQDHSGEMPPSPFFSDLEKALDIKLDELEELEETKNNQTPMKKA